MSDSASALDPQQAVAEDAADDAAESAPLQPGGRFVGADGPFWRLLVRGALLLVVTLGLAYPWAQASLERFKVGHTFYGDLKGRFEGSGFRLFFRGLLMWLVVVVPFLLGATAAFAQVDWVALGEALQRGGDDVASRI